MRLTLLSLLALSACAVLPSNGTEAQKRVDARQTCVEMGFEPGNILGNTEYHRCVLSEKLNRLHGSATLL